MNDINVNEDDMFVNPEDIQEIDEPQNDKIEARWCYDCYYSFLFGDKYLYGN